MQNSTDFCRSRLFRACIGSVKLNCKVFLSGNAQLPVVPKVAFTQDVLAKHCFALRHCILKCTLLASVSHTHMLCCSVRYTGKFHNDRIRTNLATLFGSGSQKLASAATESVTQQEAAAGGG